MKSLTLLILTPLCLLLNAKPNHQQQDLEPYFMQVFERINEKDAWQRVGQRKPQCRIKISTEYLQIKGDHNILIRLEKRVQKLNTKEFSGIRWQAFDLTSNAKCHADIMASFTGEEVIINLTYLFEDKEQLITYQSKNNYQNLIH